MDDKEIVVQPQPEKSVIEMDSSGYIKPKDLGEMMRLSTAYLRSGMLPARFKSPEQVLVAFQMALELGLPPLTGIRQIAIVNGNPSLYGDLPLAVVQQSGNMESIREYHIDDKGKEICTENGNLAADAWGAVCIVKRKGDIETLETFFTMEDAKKAALLGSPVWKKYPKRMLKYRARGQALKDKFSDSLNGISQMEYDHNEVIETTTTAKTNANKQSSII